MPRGGVKNRLALLSKAQWDCYSLKASSILSACAALHPPLSCCQFNPMKLHYQNILVKLSIYLNRISEQCKFILYIYTCIKSSRQQNPFPVWSVLDALMVDWSEQILATKSCKWRVKAIVAAIKFIFWQCGKITRLLRVVRFSDRSLVCMINVKLEPTSC